MRYFSIFLFVTTVGAFAETPVEMLTRIDRQRSFPDLQFSLVVTSYEADRVKTTNTIWGYVKTNEGASKALLWFAEPSSVKGRKMLLDGPLVYLLFPKTRNPIRLSPLQVLLGEASNADVARSDFSKSFDVESFAREKKDGIELFRFQLKVKREFQDSTYKRIDLRVDASTLRPLSADFFANGDTVLKRAEYSDYRTVEGKSIPYKVEIFDTNRPEKHTVLAYQSVGRLDVPDSIFRREYLETWTPKVAP